MRHNEVTIDTEQSFASLTWAGPMGPVSAAMKLCILEPELKRTAYELAKSRNKIEVLVFLKAQM
jgi:hypothetical protein